MVSTVARYPAVTTVTWSGRARVLGTAAALVVAGCVVSSDGDVPLAAAESAASGQPPPARLSGVYRAAVFGSRGTFDGEPYTSQDAVRWYSFGTSCSATCTAHAIEVDEDGRALVPGRAFDVAFQRGRWIGAPAADAAPCLADPTRDVALSVEWRLDPHPDGSLTGTRTVTESTSGTPPCVGSGGGYEVPVTLTPVPAGPPQS